MVKVDGRYYGSKSGGTYELSGDSDNGEPIEAFFELITSDWGIPNQKRIRLFYVGYETDGFLTLTVRDDEGREFLYTLEPIHVPNLQHGIKVYGTRDLKGRYWMLRIDNVNGSDFSIDNIQVLPVVLSMKPSAA
jgi:hypothetical protein